MPMTCEDVADMTFAEWDEGCCALTAPDVCECRSWAPYPAGAHSDTYTVNGTSMDVGGVNVEFCVDGDTLSIRTGVGTDNEVVEVMVAS